MCLDDDDDDDDDHYHYHYHYDYYLLYIMSVKTFIHLFIFMVLEGIIPILKTSNFLLVVFLFFFQRIFETRPGLSTPGIQQTTLECLDHWMSVEDHSKLFQLWWTDLET